MSQGTTNYIDSVQEQTLTSYPITIEQESVNSAGMLAAFASTARCSPRPIPAAIKAIARPKNHRRKNGSPSPIFLPLLL